MARLALTTKLTPGKYPTLPLAADSADVVFTAAGAQFADGFSFDWSEDTVLLVRNANAAPQTVTINSVATNTHKRTGDITTYSLAASDIAVFGPFPADGWRQSTGKIHGAASAADVQMAAVRLNRP